MQIGCRKSLHKKRLWVNASRCKSIDARKSIISETVQQIGDIWKENWLRDFKATAAPAEWKWWQQSDSRRAAQLFSKQFHIITRTKRKNERRISWKLCNRIPGHFIVIKKICHWKPHWKFDFAYSQYITITLFYIYLLKSNNEPNELRCMPYEAMSQRNF